MATATRGCLGVVKVRDLAATGGSEANVGGLQEWSISQEAEQIDSSELGSCAKSSIAGANSRSLSLSGFWDPASGANQTEITVGNILHVEVYPAGSGSGSTYYETTTGGATVTTIEQSGGNDSLVTFSASLSINGDLTTATVA